MFRLCFCGSSAPYNDILTVADAELAECALVDQQAEAVETMRAAHESERAPLKAETARLQVAYEATLVRASNARVVASTQREARTARQNEVAPIRLQQQNADERYEVCVARQERELLDLRQRHERESADLRRLLREKLVARGVEVAALPAKLVAVEPGQTTRRTVQTARRTEEKPQPLPPPPHELWQAAAPAPAADSLDCNGVERPPSPPGSKSSRTSRAQRNQKAITAGSRHVMEA